MLWVEEECLVKRLFGRLHVTVEMFEDAEEGHAVWIIRISNDRAFGEFEGPRQILLGERFARMFERWYCLRHRATRVEGFAGQYPSNHFANIVRRKRFANIIGNAERKC